VAAAVTPTARPEAMAAGQSSVLQTSSVAVGRMAAGHRSGLVLPESVFNASS
jgi:hypothetical protein